MPFAITKNFPLKVIRLLGLCRWKQSLQFCGKEKKVSQKRVAWRRKFGFLLRHFGCHAIVTLIYAVVNFVPGLRQLSPWRWQSHCVRTSFIDVGVQLSPDQEFPWLQNRRQHRWKVSSMKLIFKLLKASKINHVINWASLQPTVFKAIRLIIMIETGFERCLSGREFPCGLWRTYA